MLRGQKPYLDKTGLRYVEEINEESSKDSQYRIPTCIYCFKRDTLLKNASPEGKLNRK